MYIKTDLYIFLLCERKETGVAFSGEDSGLAMQASKTRVQRQADHR